MLLECEHAVRNDAVNTESPRGWCPVRCEKAFPHDAVHVEALSAAVRFEPCGVVMYLRTERTVQFLLSVRGF